MKKNITFCQQNFPDKIGFTFKILILLLKDKQGRKNPELSKNGNKIRVVLTNIF